MEYENTEDPAGAVSCHKCDPESALVTVEGLKICITETTPQCTKYEREENETAGLVCLECKWPFTPTADQTACTVTHCAEDEMPCESGCVDESYKLNIDKNICTDNEDLSLCEIINREGNSCLVCNEEAFAFTMEDKLFCAEYTEDRHVDYCVSVHRDNNSLSEPHCEVCEMFYEPESEDGRCYPSNCLDEPKNSEGCESCNGET
jgi:hypothetical protein